MVVTAIKVAWKRKVDMNYSHLVNFEWEDVCDDQFVFSEWITVGLAAGWCVLLILPPRASTASSAHSTVIEAICNVSLW